MGAKPRVLKLILPIVCLCQYGEAPAQVDFERQGNAPIQCHASDGTVSTHTTLHVALEECTNRGGGVVVRNETINVQSSQCIAQPGDPQTPNSPDLGQTLITDGDVRLSWVAPTMNVDGSPLLDLAGFYVYLQQVIPIVDPGALEITLPVSPGVYLWEVSAYDTAGNESPKSESATFSVLQVN